MSYEIDSCLNVNFPEMDLKIDKKRIDNWKIPTERICSRIHSFFEAHFVFRVRNFIYE